MEYKELTEQIIGCAYYVYNKMGYGFLEERDSSVISRNKEPEVSIIKSGKRNLIPDPDTLTYLKKTFDQVIQLEPVFYDRIEVGTPIPSIILSIVPKILILQFKWSDVLTILDAQLSDILLSTTINLPPLENSMVIY